MITRTALITAVLLGAAMAAAQTVVPGFALDTVADPVAQGRAMVFAPDGRLFYTENSSGRIMVINDPAGSPSTPSVFATVSGLLAPGGDDLGLHGIALHPDFPSDPAVAANRYVYVAHATGGAPQLVVKRFTESTTNPGEAQTGSETTLFSSIDMGSSGNNFGGRLAFDAQGRLYVSVGDGGAAVSLAGSFAQDVNDRRGKILRYTAEGSIPLANPLTDNPMFARGFRNPRGMALNPETLELFSLDTGNPATSGVGELNVVLAGNNYGWDTSGISGPRTDPAFSNPGWTFNASFLPSSLAFHPQTVTGASPFPAPGHRNGVAYVGSEAATGSVHRVILTGSNERAGVAMRELATGFPQPVRDLRFGPDGNLYVLTAGVLYRIRYIGNQSPNDPVARAGDDQAVNAGQVVTLNGAASSDPDAGTILRYTWRQVGGSVVVTLSDATSVTPTFTAPQVPFDQAFTFELIVEDGNGGVDNDFVIVTVQSTGTGDDEPPSLTTPVGEGGCSTGTTPSRWWLLPLACLGLLVLRRTPNHNPRQP
jgi:glucose/arabinose dehydrogenase